MPSSERKVSFSEWFSRMEWDSGREESKESSVELSSQRSNSRFKAKRVDLHI